MIGTHASALRSQSLISLIVLLSGLYAAWKLGGWISGGNFQELIYSAIGLALCVIAVTIARNWRSGFYLFLIWLAFEDLARKYLGNNMMIYFAKDVLAGLTYLALYLAIRQGRARTFHPRFLLVFSMFFWLAVLQIFNPYSPSLLYGLLGMKIYFYYVPLIFVGYALIRNESDLRRFLLVSLLLASVISAVGIIQATASPNFLNPTILAPEINKLGNLEKVTPITDQIFLLPASIFVSTGRFAFFLVLAIILGLGAAAYAVLSWFPKRILVFTSIAMISVAVLLSGSRTAFMYSFISLAALAGIFLWGAPWRWGQAHRLVKAVRRSAIFAALGLATFIFLFPSTAGSRWAFYSQTLSPESSAFELTNRAWDYPVRNLMDAFSEPHWVVGSGIGTASLGVQYVSKFLGTPEPNVWVEEGYGQLIVEMGILGPILWLLWTATLLWMAWKAIQPLRQTRMFPIASAILWYAFILLYPLTYLGLDAFQNYVNNAFLWILIGILFRLPEIESAKETPFLSRQKSRIRTGYLPARQK
ncbi:MAG TPA: hypothetical protein VGT03_06160 [Candidatus Acidoferrales bacterium]|nr:hypothetical protein [Candidatus Acidoferrales bacterium]